MTTYSPPNTRAASGFTARVAALAAFASLLLPALAAAAEAPQPLTGTAEAGSAKSAVCLACHGPNGNSVNPEWPNLAGQNAAYITRQLTMFKAGQRKNELMSPISMTLSEQDIVDLAAHFSVQSPAGLEADPSFWKAGEKLYRGGDPTRGIPACIACHGPVGRGVPAAAYPALRAQHSVYTVKQLAAYAAKQRYAADDKGAMLGGQNAQMMVTIASRLTDEDRRNLASYIQGMR
jgi:cytochrome c553